MVDESTVERLDALEERLQRVERRLVVAAAAERPERRERPVRVATAAQPVPPAPARAPGPAEPVVSLEQLLGGRVLAWAGGVAIVVGLAFLFALAVSSGWVGEAARCLLGGGLALALVAGGAWLHERRGGTEAARAAAAAGVAGLFLTVTVASQRYGVVAPAAAMVLAGAIGALGATLALRWDARVMGALGVVGAALAPVLAGAEVDGGSLAFTWLAFAAGAAVLARRRWAPIAYVLWFAAAWQWVPFAFAGAQDPVVVLVLLTVFAAPAVAIALGFDLGRAEAELRDASAGLLALNALVLGLVGFFALDALDERTLGLLTLGGLAAAHVAGGLACRRARAVPGGLELVLLALGALLADAALGLWLDGAPRALAWSLGAVGFAGLVRHARRRAVVADERAAVTGLGLHVALAVTASATTVDLGTLFDGAGAGGAAIVALAGLAAACLVAARTTPQLRLALDATGLLSAMVLAASVLDGTALTAVWAAEAVALAAIARQEDDDVARGAALLHLLAAGAWALADQAPPIALAEGLPAAVVGAAVAGVGAVALAAARVAWLCGDGSPERTAAGGGAALVALYGASVLVVSAGTDAMQGQFQLSALWACVGVAALVVGLRRDVRAIRLGALALLGLAAGKVFVIDLATLASAYRVLSFLALGVLLLLGALAYGRMRPDVLPAARSR